MEIAPATAKRLGFSTTRRLRRALGDRAKAGRTRPAAKRGESAPVIKSIDTRPPSTRRHTNYLYMSYFGIRTTSSPPTADVIVLGSRRLPDRLERRVRLVRRQRVQPALQKPARRSVMVNCNPETV